MIVKLVRKTIVELHLLIEEMLLPTVTLDLVAQAHLAHLVLVNVVPLHEQVQVFLNHLELVIAPLELDLILDLNLFGEMI